MSTRPARPRPAQPWERGQAIVLLALAIVALLGFAALALDGGNLYTEQRRAQAAADNAVMAAAFSSSRGVTTTASLRSVALSNAAGNQYNNNQTTNWVIFNRPPTHGPYANNNDYLEVVITQTVPTALAHLVYRQTPIPLTVYAVAHGTQSGPMMPGFAIAAFTVVCDGNQMTGRGGVGSIIKDGGVFINATTGCAQSFNTAGNNARIATTTSAACPDTSIPNDQPGGCIINGQYPISIGGLETGTHTTVCTRPPDIDWWTVSGLENDTTDCNFYPAPQQVAQILNYPVPQINFTCDPTNRDSLLEVSGATKYLLPGTYTTMNPSNQQAKLELASGIYCITSKDSNGAIMQADSITGLGVFIYVQDPAAKFSFSGNGSSLLNLSAPFAGEHGLNCDVGESDPSFNPLCRVKGIVYYKPQGQNGTSCDQSKVDIDFAGQASMVIRGLIWAPQSFIRYTGNGDLYMTGQMLVGCAKYDGNGTMDITYSPDATYGPPPAVRLDQ